MKKIHRRVKIVNSFGENFKKGKKLKDLIESIGDEPKK